MNIRRMRKSIRNHLWEMVKMKIGEHSMRFGAFQKRKMAEEQEEVERSISALEKHIIDGHADDSEKERIWTKLIKLGNVN